jgi:predicted nucleic acid-binding protein
VALGLPVVGTLGILIKAKQKGLLPAIRPQIKALLQANFYITPALYQHALALAGEIET